MNINIVSEPVEPSAFWVTDILDGIMKESMKKALNIVAVTDGNIYRNLYRAEDSPRIIALVVGYSIPWLIDTVDKLKAIEVEPILVSVYQHRFENHYSFTAFNTLEAMKSLITYLCGIKREDKIKKIALFGFHRDTVGDMAKINGFISGIKANGLTACKEDIFSRGIMAECAQRLYENIKYYDAAVCTSDLLAVYLTLYLEKRGVRIPDDIYITGFGNWNFINTFKPGITRMYTDLNELGCQAVRLHQYMQYNSKAKNASTVLECGLQINESTAFQSFGIRHGNMDTQFSTEGNYNDNEKNISGYKAPAYYSDPDIVEVLKAELYIRNTDSIDRSIVRSIFNNVKYQDISEKINVSEATIKYRMNKMLKAVGFSDKQELFAFLLKYNLFV